MRNGALSIADGGALEASGSARILLVDDFEPWRRLVRSMISGNARYRVVAEAADGWEAVQKAEKLNPDLVLLDIGLPGMNGIEVARRLRQILPGTGILFLTSNHDPDVLRAALNTGAQGYVLKRNAGTELLLAMTEILATKRKCQDAPRVIESPVYSFELET